VGLRNILGERKGEVIGGCVSQRPVPRVAGKKGVDIKHIATGIYYI